MKTFRLGKLFDNGFKVLTVDLIRLIASRLLVMASSGGGKSWLLRKLIEIFYGHVQIIVLDVEGEFSSLRKKYDFVVAGKDADISTAPHLAAALATRALELRFNLIADLYELHAKDRILFVRRFLEAMVNAPKNLWHPVIIILDEAHIFAPEQGSAESLQAVTDMISRGRKRGFCLIPATQRLSKLHKDVAAECQNKLIGLANIDLDRKRGADELGFTNRADIITMRDLEPGEFYAVGPAFSIKGVNKVTIDNPITRPAKTGTGKTGTPAPTAKIKAMLTKLADLPKEVEQEAKTLVQLRTENAQLKNQKAEAERALKFLKAQEERKAVNSDTMTKAVAKASVEGKQLGYGQAYADVIKLLSDTAKTLKDKKFQAAVTAFVVAKEPTHTPYKNFEPIREKKAAVVGDGWAQVVGNINASGTKGEFSAYELDILAVLNMKPGADFSYAAIAAQSGRSQQSSAFSKAVNNLIAKGLVSKASPGRVGLAHGVNVDHLVKSAPAGLDQWLSKLKGTEREFLRVLIGHKGVDIPKERLCAESDPPRSMVSSGVDGAINKLISLGLIENLSESMKGAVLRLKPEHVQ